MKKRLMACLLAICLLASMLPPSALAAADGEEKEEALSINASSGDRTITVTPKTGGGDDPGGKPGGSVTGNSLSLFYDGNAAPIKRDYEQEVKVKVRNTSDQAVEYYLECENNNEDLYMNFVSSGSEKAPLTIPSGGEQEVTLSVFAQNATKTLYTIQVKAFITGESSPIEMDLTFRCEAAGGSVDFSKGNVDPATLTTVYTVRNSGGNKITDLSLSLTGEAAGYVRISPSVENYELDRDDTVTVKLIPDLGKMKTDNKTTVSGKLVASGGASQEVDVAFDTQGKEITSMSMDELAMIQDENPYHDIEFVESGFSFTTNITGEETTMAEVTDRYYEEGNAEKDGVNTPEELKAVLDTLITPDAMIDFTINSEMSYDGGQKTMPVSVRVSSAVADSSARAGAAGRTGTYYDPNTDEVTTCYQIRVPAKEYIDYLNKVNDTAGYLDIDEWKQTIYDISGVDDTTAEVILTIESTMRGEQFDFLADYIDASNWVDYSKVNDVYDYAMNYKVITDLADATKPVSVLSDTLDYLETGIDIYKTGAVWADPNISVETKAGYTTLQVVKNVNTYVGGTLLSKAGVALGTAVGDGPGAVVGYFAGHVISGLIGWGLDEWIGDMEDNMYGVLYYDIYGRQCTNAGRVSSDFYVPDFGDNNDDIKIYETGRMYDGSPYGGNAGYAEDQFGGDNYIHNRDVNYDYYLNGEKVGNTKNNGLTQVSIAEIGGKGLKPGKNTLVRDYDTNAGHYSVVADTEITILYPLDTQISYIGTPEGLEDVRSLPDFAVYTENILPSAAIIGEETDVTVYVYNRGSRGGWADISIGDGSQTFTTKTNVYMKAFSEEKLTFQWTPSAATTNFTVTLKNKSVNLEERKTDNNTASRTVTARSRQVPKIGDITPTQVMLDGSQIRLIAGITQIADVKSVSFEVNGAGYEGNGVRLTGLSDTAAQAATGVDSSKLKVGDNTVNVRVTYQKNKTETATVEKTATLQAQVPGTISFSVDSTVTNPQFYVYTHSGSTVSGVEVAPAAGGNGYTLTNNAATSKEPGGYDLLTVCDGGVIVTGLDKLSGAALTLSGAAEVTINSGEAALDRVSLIQINGNYLGSNRQLNLSDGNKLRLSGVTSYSLNLRYKIPGLSNRTYYQTVTQGDAVNQTIDLSKFFQLYRINLPAGKGYDGNTDFSEEIRFTDNYGSSSVYVQDTKYDTAANQLLLLVNGTSRLPGATDVQAFVTADENTLYVVDLKDYSAPVSATWNHYKVSFLCEQANDLQVYNTQLTSGDYTCSLLGNTLYLPAGTYRALVNYWAGGQQLQYEGQLAVSTQDITVQLPGPITNSAGVTFTWPSVWENEAFLTYSAQRPDGSNTRPTVQAVKDKPVALPADGSDWVLILSRGEWDNQIAQAYFELELALTEGSDTKVAIGNSFTGTANISGNSHEAGTTCWASLSNLKDETGTVLTNYYANRSAGHLNGRVTLTEKDDASRVYTAFLSTGNVNGVQFTLPDDMEAGAYTCEVFLTTEKLEGSPCSVIFDANGGSGSMEDITVGSGEDFTLPPCEFSAPSNRTFKAWSIDGVEYAPGYVYTVVEDITLIAVWTDTGTAPAGPGTSVPSSVTTGEDADRGTTTTAKLTATVKNNAVTAAVSTSIGNELVRQAERNNSDTVVLDLSVRGNVNETTVSIPASVINQINSKTGADLIVSTPVASVMIQNGGLGSLASMGGTVDVSARKTGSTVELAVTAGGKTVDSVPGGLMVTVPVEEVKPGTVAMLVQEDGTRAVIRRSTAKDSSVVIPLDGCAKIEIVDNSKQFDDVPETSWAAGAVAFASAHELFNGTGATTFSPELPMSRGMLAVVLHNLENNPSQTPTDAFNDVDNGKWYAEGIAWAAEKGIITGYGNGKFGPDDNITREQLAVMLWRYAGSPAAGGGKLSFTDAGKVSSWALDAMDWATEKDVIHGKGGGVLDPGGQATRAETAQMLKNYLEG